MSCKSEGLGQLPLEVDSQADWNLVSREADVRENISIKQHLKEGRKRTYPLLAFLFGSLRVCRYHGG